MVNSSHHIRVHASAPGKIILFGEHAVVYGRPAIAAPVTQVQVRASVEVNSEEQVWIEAPEISLFSELSLLPPDNPLSLTIKKVLDLLGAGTLPPCTIKIHSTIPVASGLGSGTAVSVAVIRAISEFLGFFFTDEQVSSLVYEIEKLHHGTPSGIDNTVITLGKPVYFIKNMPTETIHSPSPMTFIIGNTGVSAPTKRSVEDVRNLWFQNKSQWEKVFDLIGNTTQQGRIAFEKGNLVKMGELMNINHSLLQELTVSSPELDNLVLAARKAGALGAKLSGGGRGGNMIALVEPGKTGKVVESLKLEGAPSTIITTIQ